jgi:hypothetical protein
MTITLSDISFECRKNLYQPSSHASFVIIKSLCQSNWIRKLALGNWIVGYVVKPSNARLIVRHECMVYRFLADSWKTYPPQSTFMVNGSMLLVCAISRPVKAALLIGIVLTIYRCSCIGRKGWSRWGRYELEFKSGSNQHTIEVPGWVPWRLWWSWGCIGTCVHDIRLSCKPRTADSLRPCTQVYNWQQ